MSDRTPAPPDWRMGLAVSLTLTAFLTCGFALGFTAASDDPVYLLGALPSFLMILAAHLLLRGATDEQ